ncbi:MULTISPECIES: hypothetical protein [Streptomyces]|uniref:hypothetical protein n=1 Tax=Streptomyces TaxID=1883 RepID=UPI00368AD068
MKVRGFAARAAVVAAGVVMVAGGATAAYADMDSYTSGAHSWRTGSGVGAPDRMAAVQDTKADGNSVYTSYNRDSQDGPMYTLHNKSGEGTTAYSGTGGVIYDMKACTSEPGPDDCSAWWSDR